MKTASRWFSPRIEQEISLVRWGHWGQPVLLFPTAGGDAEESERFHLIGAIGHLIESGRIRKAGTWSPKPFTGASSSSRRERPWLPLEA